MDRGLTYNPESLILVKREDWNECDIDSVFFYGSCYNFSEKNVSMYLPSEIEYK